MEVPVNQKDARLGVLRIFLGFLQVTGALTTLFIFIQIGDRKITFVSLAATLAITATSMVIFRKNK